MLYANLSAGDAGVPFNSGEVSMYFWSTSAVGAIERAKGDFELKQANILAWSDLSADGWKLSNDGFNWI